MLEWPSARNLYFDEWFIVCLIFFVDDVESLVLLFPIPFLSSIRRNLGLFEFTRRFFAIRKEVVTGLFRPIFQR